MGMSSLRRFAAFFLACTLAGGTLAAFGAPLQDAADRAAPAAPPKDAAPDARPADPSPAPAQGAPGGDGVRWVEFLPPWDDASPSATDMSFLLDPPAGKRGRVVVCGEHLCFEDGMRARFWGVNLLEGSAFPSKDEAEKIAGHIAKLGFNAVRFHHMSDAWWLGAAIDPSLPRYNQTADLLDRFDYFVYQLRKKGIYLFFASNVHPPYANIPGVPDRALLSEGDRNSRALTRLATAVDPTLQALQKRFLTFILTHQNPYTGLRYTDDPAVAFVEIANENSLVDTWSSNWPNRLDKLPPHYQQKLDQLWQQWLSERDNRMTGISANLVQSPSTTPGNLLERSRPVLELHNQARAAVKNAEGISQITIIEPGTERWHVQWRWNSLALEAEKKYRLTLRIRSSEPRSVGLVVQEQGPPWKVVGLDKEVQTSTDWTDVSLTFVARYTARPYKLALTMGDALGSVEVADVSLEEVPLSFLDAKGATGTTGTAGTGLSQPARPSPTRDSGQNAVLNADYIAFLADLDRRYYSEMRRYIRELGYRGPVIGTQTASWAALAVQAEVSDVIDAHAYWDHPRFPGQPWSPTDWQIHNQPMPLTTVPSPLSELAFKRVAGKPFVVSEFNHALPNEYDAPAIPVIAAFAAQQDWDGVFLFHLDATPAEIARRRSHFFDLNRHGGKMATLPLAAALFLRQDVGPLPPANTLAMSVDQAAAAKRRFGWDLSLALSQTGAPVDDILRQRKAVGFQPAVQTASRPTIPPRPQPLAASGSQNLHGTPAFTEMAPGRLWSLDSPNSAAAFGIFAKGERIRLGPWSVESKAPFQGLIGAVSLTGEPLNRARRVLLTTAGTTRLQGMRWNDRRDSVGNHWGNGTPEVAVPPLLLNLDDKATISVLDARGQTTNTLTASPGPYRWRINIGQGASTWHLIER